MKLKEIRKLYTDFFQSKGHTLVKSSSLIPENDPTLLFANAGMNQFKDVFIGKEKRSYTRATSSQKCVRAGGKHNDLDNVGYTTRHHTFFEMLGNFSFGDYFKEGAITYAWEFLSKVLKLPKDKLYFTVYPKDIEARNLWKKIANVDDSRVLDIEDNIWAMGDTGPCGFDTEIFYDKGSKIQGGLPGTKDEDGDRYIEIWNNVFMQYETLPSGEKIELKNKNIDTGMGLERITSVMQGVDDNFDIDLFQNLMKYTEEILKIKKSPENTASFKIITDHIRSCSFLIADGVLPSNEGRGYVLRRIIRRALRYINMLGIKEPIFYKIHDAVKNEMGETYPELIEADNLIKQTIKTEEENFNTTLDYGIKLLNEEISKTSGKILNGKTAFKLYDTYGFPIDLTSDILRSHNMTVNIDEFEKEMSKQKEKSKSSSNFKGEAGNKQIFYELKEKLNKTEFTGYKTLETNSQIISILQNEKLKDYTDDNEEYLIITDKTPFYAECGGQIADKGIIKDSKNNIYEVLDVQKIFDIYLHKIKITNNQKLSVNDIIKMKVNTDYRNKIKANHSAVHLLHSALKTVIGQATSQKGSWVGFENFRFDFTSTKALNTTEIAEIEKIVNKYINDKLEIITKEMPINEAKQSGAIALFGEKYSDIVRVVSIGNISSELCGGTHCKNTSEIKFFKILKEESIAAGIRRIEGITGNTALNFASKYITDISKPANILITELQNKIKAEEELQSKQKEEEYKNKKSQEEKNKNTKIKNAISSTTTKFINNTKFILGNYKDLEANYLKEIIDKIKTENKENTIITLFTTNNDKISVITSISNNLLNKSSAINIVKEISTILDGKGGGGKPELAQAGGTNINKIKTAIEFLEKYIEEINE